MVYITFTPVSYTHLDGMYLLHLRCPQAVFSHDTALFLHDLTDREPLAYTVTVKSGYNPHRLKGDGVKVYRIKAELHLSLIHISGTHLRSRPLVIPR